MIDSCYIGSFVFNIVLLIIGLFIFYRIILLAVREGINQSVIGKYIQNKHEMQNDEAFQS